MAKLIPEIDPAAIELKPERDVAIALVRDLPDNCWIYHSYCWLKPDRDHSQQPLREGEADFVILDPRFGLLVLEVKGGPISQRVVDGREEYYREISRGGTRDITHPFRQASGNLHHIEEILGLNPPAHWFGGTYGYAVAFPDCTTDRSVSGPLLLPHDVKPPVVFFAEHLEDMDRAVRGAFKAWSRRKHSTLTNDAVNRCREGLHPLFRLMPARWRNVEDDERRLIQLTTQQQQALDGLRDNDRLAVRGGAGTGKTLLAFWRAVTFAKEGQDTLMLCYNTALADWLNERADIDVDADARKRLTISTFHSLCRKFYVRAGLAFQAPPLGPESQTFWNDEVPDTMFDFVLEQIAEPRYDAVVVDEGQDFAANWWLVVESLKKHREGPFYVFYDPFQNVFGTENTLPKTNAVFRLTFNCRNTREIHKFSMQYVDAELQSGDFVPAGVAPETKTMTSLKRQREECEEVIKVWKKSFRLTANRIAILTGDARQNSCLADTLRIAGFPIVNKAGQWRSGEGILFSTIKTFKGLEADAVVILTTDDGKRSSDLDSYVAASRAKHLLAVINCVTE